jgi:hypothetical protein
MSETKKTGIDLELDATVAEGHYANLAIISHSPTEFVIDFAAIMPGVPKAKIKSRIILAPEHAKRLLMSLQDNITRYESSVGRIEVRGTSATTEGTEDGHLTLGFIPAGEA